MRILRLRLRNFLSFREADLDFDGFTALVGPNAAGKSNAVAALKLLHEIPVHGLPLAIARRGGFDQLRHRSRGHPYDPSIGVDFTTTGNDKTSHYDLTLGAVPGGRYVIKSEVGIVHNFGHEYRFEHKRGKFEDQSTEPVPRLPDNFGLPPGTSALTLAPTLGAFVVGRAMLDIRIVAINPSRVGELQDPSSTTEFDADGSNTASFFEQMGMEARQRLVTQLSVVVPSIEKIEPSRFSDKITLAFYQAAKAGEPRRFFAKQMSDGTLRAFGQLLALHAHPASLTVIEEPEIAIHLGALRALMEILQAERKSSQIVITTHSADIVDTLRIDQLRVVWNQDGASHIAHLAQHTKDVVKSGLVTPGDLLRSDALDPVLV